MFFFFNDTATTEIYTLSLHDALPIWNCWPSCARTPSASPNWPRPIRRSAWRSEEHTSELQSLTNLVCRLLLEKKKKINVINQQSRREHWTTVDCVLSVQRTAIELVVM